MQPQFARPTLWWAKTGTHCAPVLLHGYKISSTEWYFRSDGKPAVGKDKKKSPQLVWCKWTSSAAVKFNTSAYIMKCAPTKHGWVDGRGTQCQCRRWCTECDVWFVEENGVNCLHFFVCAGKITPIHPARPRKVDRCARQCLGRLSILGAYRGDYVPTWCFGDIDSTLVLATRI